MTIHMGDESEAKQNLSRVVFALVGHRRIKDRLWDAFNLLFMFPDDFADEAAHQIYQDIHQALTKEASREAFSDAMSEIEAGELAETIFRLFLIVHTTKDA
jgi:hypothetical protein